MCVCWGKRSRVSCSEISFASYWLRLSIKTHFILSKSNLGWAARRTSRLIVRRTSDPLTFRILPCEGDGEHLRINERPWGHHAFAKRTTSVLRRELRHFPPQEAPPTLGLARGVWATASSAVCLRDALLFHLLGSTVRCCVSWTSRYPLPRPLPSSRRALLKHAWVHELGMRHWRPPGWIWGGGISKS